MVWLRSRPQVIGRLPSDDMRAIRSLLDQRMEGLGAAVRDRSREELADWLLNHRAGQLMRLEVQASNRVLAFLRTSERSQGQLLVFEKSEDGWRVSETNNRVLFR